MAEKQNKIKSKFEAIKKLNDEPNRTIDNAIDLVRDDLPSVDGVIRRRIDDYQQKSNATRTGNRDIFSEIIGIAETFLGADGETNIDLNQKPKVTNKLMTFGQDASLITLNSAKQIIMDNVQSELFSGDGICGSIKHFWKDEISISPNEFDFLNMLKISPDSVSGKIIYEDLEESGYIKMNRDFYSTFESLTYTFTTNQGKVLFNLEWDNVNQLFIVSGLLNNETIQDFLMDYYSNIEFPDIGNVIKETMLLTINGDGSEPKTFTIKMDWLDTLLQKIFSVCGQRAKETPLDQNAAEQVDDEIDLDYYFDFNNTEGINIDDESNRLKRVLKFTDCNNFETQIDKAHIEDFVYFFSRNRNSDDNVRNTIERIAKESFESGGDGIPSINLQISLTLKYLLNLPRAIVATVLSPKMFFPIAVVYKSTKEVYENIDVAEIMKKLSKLFYKIIRDIFWKFIKEFWSFVKIELLKFLKKLAIKILKNKLKRFKSILSSLTALLRKLLELNVDSCESIYDLILTTIQSTLNTKMNIPIPGVLLSFSDQSAGYSTDGAYMNIIEKLTAAGVPTEPLYGRDNDLNTIVKSIIEGHTEEMDANSYVKIALKPTIIAVAPGGGGGIITPQVVGTGKIF